MSYIQLFQKHGILLVFAILTKPTSASETILNEIVIHPFWSLWATSMGLAENPASFTISYGSNHCSPWPLFLWVEEPREAGGPHKTHHTRCLDQRILWFSISSEAASSAPQAL